MKKKLNNVWFRSGLPPSGNRGPIPITWQGWLTWLFFILALFGSAYLLTLLSPIIGVIGFVIATVLFLKIVSKTMK